MGLHDTQGHHEKRPLDTWGNLEIGHLKMGLLNVAPYI